MVFLPSEDSLSEDLYRPAVWSLTVSKPSDGVCEVLSMARWLITADLKELIVLETRWMTMAGPGLSL